MWAPMMLLPTFLALLGCAGEQAAAPLPDERDAHARWAAACRSETASFDACRAHCMERAVPAERTDCFFQLAEAAPRWTDGDVRRALGLVYSICGGSPDFGSQCFRHALHEVAISCNAQGVPWMEDPTFDGGDRWAPWQACVARNVLQRQGATCLPPRRESYHNLWVADDAPLCGL